MSGAQLYNGACATCHGSRGEGTKDSRRFYPALVGSSAVQSDDPSNLIMTITNGVDRTSASGHAFMPAFRYQFTDAELAKVANYVSTQFGAPEHVISINVVQRTMQGESGSWLIRHAQTLSIAAIIIVLFLLAGMISRLRRR